MENPESVSAYYTITPALAFRGAADAIEWYKVVFGAKETLRLENPDKTIAHAQIVIGGSAIMVSEENLQYNSTPKTLGGNTVNLHIYVPNVDVLIEKAASMGAEIIIPAADQFYGDRSGRIKDPFGYVWIVATHVRDVSEEEMQKAFDEMMKQS